jgi:maltose-binding protein MalE
VPRPATPAYITIRNSFAQAVHAIIAGGDVQAELSKAAATIDADIARNRGYRP